MQLVGQTYNAAKDLCGVNCPEVVLFRNPTAPNVMLMVHRGQAKIVYQPQFITGIYDRFGDAGVSAVMAHEIGHALDDSLGAPWVDKRWTPELRADGWAGCVLAKNNLSAHDVRSALAALEASPPLSSGPWELRLQAIRTGYTQCGGAAANFQTGAGRAR